MKFWEDCVNSHDLFAKKICIDATGFLRPHLMFLLYLLYSKGLRTVDIIYSEPEQYIKKDLTVFSDRKVEEVRQVKGFEGNTNNTDLRDVLVIGAGYETHLISEVADDKERAKKIIILGLPSLQADMYQQNAWRTWQAADALGEDLEQKHFAPAFDPFVTAEVLREIVEHEQNMSPIGHLYLSPLATKAQAIGFALFFLTEYRNTNASIIYPFCERYDRETSIGLSRIWLYTLEFAH